MRASPTGTLLYNLLCTSPLGLLRHGIQSSDRSFFREVISLRMRAALSKQRTLGIHFVALSDLSSIKRTQFCSTEQIFSLISASGHQANQLQTLTSVSCISAALKVAAGASRLFCCVQPSASAVSARGTFENFSIYLPITSSHNLLRYVNLSTHIHLGEVGGSSTSILVYIHQCKYCIVLGISIPSGSSSLRSHTRPT